MNRFIRMYNQNRRLIIEIVIGIIAIIFFVQVFDNIAKNNKKNRLNDNISNIVENSVLIENTTSKVYNKSAISGENIEVNSVYIDTIKKFLDYCNKLDYKNAYSMITNECKNELFPTADLFKTNYLQKNFSTNKTYSIQNWTENTYLISLDEDVMATGKSNVDNSIKDYITVKIEDGNYKLNINNYIGKTLLNLKTNHNNIEFKIIEKDTYMDFEIYKIYIKNLSGKKILLDSLETTKGIYIQDSKDVKYKLFTNELIEDKLSIDNDMSINLELKFTNAFKSDRKIERIVFSDVIADQNEYESTQDKSKYTNRLVVSIDLL